MEAITPSTDHDELDLDVIFVESGEEVAGGDSDECDSSDCTDDECADTRECD